MNIIVDESVVGLTPNWRVFVNLLIKKKMLELMHIMRASVSVKLYGRKK
jgi:hypothetical protein